MSSSNKPPTQFTFIVEGFHDEDTLRPIFPDVKYIVTHGRPYNSKLEQAIKLALRKQETVLILTDPDEHGDLIANSIQLKHPDFKRIRINPDNCHCTRHHHHKIGIEHADPMYLKQVITPYLETYLESEESRCSPD